MSKTLLRRTLTAALGLSVALGLGTLGGTAATMAGSATAAHAASSVGGQITRSEVLSRAQYWYDNRAYIPYSQSADYPDEYGRNYRTDCSGYVSMSWHLASSLTTVSLPSVAHSISKTDLLPGDILDDSGEHTILFKRWIDKTTGTFQYYAFGSTPVKIAQETLTGGSDGTIDSHPAGDYTAYRYDNIVDDAATVAHTIAIGDLNNDGKNDLIGRKTSNGDIVITPNLGGGTNGVTWGTSWVIASGWSFDQVAVGDLNNDGKNDLIGLAPNGDIWLLPNLGGGNGVTWGDEWVVARGWNFDKIDVGDLNNDGKNDLIGRRASNGEIVLIPNLGGGNGVTWGTAGVVASGWGFDYISVGDLNNDGKNDLAGRRASNGEIVLIPNLGGGNGVTWGTAWVVMNGTTFDSFDIGDLNGDGLKDITGRKSSGAVFFTPNVGGGNGVTWGTGWIVVNGSGY
ncbi:VCBS repeat-containing protein [Hamadaea sp. NPDC051192]|uniref:FG-GAP repeat domain-containing protein n=1 Tax=Hamadaea sp. NPDC051192 TaxID=3154940 RepID=UPI003414F555